MSAPSPNQMFSILDEMLIKGLQKTHLWAWWIKASSADCAAKQFIRDCKKYSPIKRFTINGKIDDLYLGLLTKLPFPTGDLKVCGKSYYFAAWKCLGGIRIFYK